MATSVKRWRPAVAVAGEIGKSECRKWHSRTGLARVCGTAIGLPGGRAGYRRRRQVARGMGESSVADLAFSSVIAVAQGSAPNSQRPTGRCRVVNGSRLRLPKARWLELTFRQRSSVHEARTLSPLQASLETCGHIVAGREPQVCSDAGCIPHSLRLLGRPLWGLGSLFR